MLRIVFETRAFISRSELKRKRKTERETERTHFPSTLPRWCQEVPAD